ncbi:MAG TPA: DUF5752 family protein [Desulfosarcina sp.]|nr:DUF5752 family protein [Desulfosarcina sp.]
MIQADTDSGDTFGITDCALIALATGESAHNLRELNDRLTRFRDPGVIYYHFWGGLLRPHFVDPEYQNHFAGWAYHDLHDRHLAERLAIVNPADFDSVYELRLAVIDVLEARMDEDTMSQFVEAEHPFFFMRSQISDIIDQLRQLARPLQGMRVVHVNSTYEGGGVAEILHRLIPLKRELGLEVDWEVITGDADFFQCTKKMHNLLQGDREAIQAGLCDHYEQVNAENFERLRSTLEAAARAFVLENYLLTRHLREYLTLMVAVLKGHTERIEV